MLLESNNSVHHEFGIAKLGYGRLILDSSQFKVITSQSQKLLLTLKVVKSWDINNHYAYTFTKIQSKPLIHSEDLRKLLFVKKKPLQSFPSSWQRMTTTWGRFHQHLRTKKLLLVNGIWQMTHKFTKWHSNFSLSLSVSIIN